MKLQILSESCLPCALSSQPWRHLAAKAIPNDNQSITQGRRVEITARTIVAYVTVEDGSKHERVIKQLVDSLLICLNANYAMIRE